MKKRKKILLIVLSILLVCAIAVACIAVANHYIFYNPQKLIEQEKTAFIAANQILYPQITYSTINSAQSTGPFQVSQPFWLNRYSNVNSEARISASGMLTTSFGKMTLTEFNDPLHAKELTVKQAVWDESSPQENQTGDIDSKGYYSVWFRFKKPLTTKEIYHQYSSLIVNHEGQYAQYGVIWIPVESSNSADDICLGMPGNFSWHVLGSDEFYNLKNNRGSFETELLFTQSLRHLINQSQDTKALMNSGLYPGCETLDFSKRLKYVEENGISCLGMVTYLRGDILKSLKTDDNLEIVKLEQDVPIQ